MKSKLSISLLVALMLTVFVSAGASASAINWGNAPASCSPDKVEKWGTHKEYKIENKIDVLKDVNYGAKAACECPPVGSFCPKVEVNKANIQFYVTVLDLKGIWKSQTFDGTQVSNFNIDELIDKADNLAFTTSILKSAVLQSGELLGKDGKHIDLSKPKSNWRKYNILVHFNLPEFEAKMPGTINAKCCPSLCRNGLTLTIKEFPQPLKYEIEHPPVLDDMDELEKEEAIKEDLIDPLKNVVDVARAAAIALGKKALFEFEGKSNAEIRTILESKFKALGYELGSGDVVEPYLDLVYPKLKARNNPDYTKLTSENNNKIKVLNNKIAPHIDAEGNPKQRVVEWKDIKTGSCVATVGRSRSGCLSEGTKISLASGGEATIETLKIGDVLKTNNGDSKIVALNKFVQEYDEMFSINGDRAFITIEHPILTEMGWKAVDPTKTKTSPEMGIVQKLEIGDNIITADGMIEVKSIDKHKISKDATAYNIKVENGGAILADGKFVSGFKLVEINY